MTHGSVVMEHESVIIDLNIIEALLSDTRGALRRSRLDEAERLMNKIEAILKNVRES